MSIEIEEGNLTRKEVLILDMGVENYNRYEARGKLIQHLQNRIAGLNRKVKHLSDEIFGLRVQQYEKQIEHDVLRLRVLTLIEERDGYRERYEQAYRELQEARRIEAGNNHPSSPLVRVYDETGVGRLLR